MKRLLLPLIAALALPAAVQSGVDPEVHKLCKDVKDYMGCVKSQSEGIGDGNVKAPSSYKYEEDSVVQWQVRGKYGRYLSFSGRTIYYDPGTSGYCSINKYGGSCTPGTPGGNRNENFRYQLDCRDRTFNRDGDEYNWMGIREDPVAETVANKYCPIINTLKKSGDGYGVWNKKADPFYSKGFDAVKDGNNEKAIYYYTKAIEALPTYANAYYSRGNAKGNLKDYQGAINDYTKAIEIYPKDGNFYYARAYYQDKLTPGKNYCNDLEQASSLGDSEAQEWLPNADCSRSKILTNRGDAKYELKDYKGAIKDYTKAIKIDPDYAYAYVGRGDAKYKLKDYKGAIKDYSQAIKIDPEYDYTYSRRGLAKSKLKDHKGAIKDYSQAIKIDPEYSSYYLRRGTAKSELKDYQGALDDYAKAIEINPKANLPFVNRAYTKYLMGNYKGAIKDAGVVLSNDPNDKYVLHTLGLAKYETNQRQSGCSAMKKSAELGLKEAKDYLASKKGSWCK